MNERRKVGRLVYAYLQGLLLLRAFPGTRERMIQNPLALTKALDQPSLYYHHPLSQHWSVGLKCASHHPDRQQLLWALSTHYQFRKGIGLGIYTPWCEQKSAALPRWAPFKQLTAYLDLSGSQHAGRERGFGVTYQPCTGHLGLNWYRRYRPSRRFSDRYLVQLQLQWNPTAHHQKRFLCFRFQISTVPKQLGMQAFHHALMVTPVNMIDNTTSSTNRADEASHETDSGSGAAASEVSSLALPASSAQVSTETDSLAAASSTQMTPETLNRFGTHNLFESPVLSESGLAFQASATQITTLIEKAKNWDSYKNSFKIRHLLVEERVSALQQIHHALRNTNPNPACPVTIPLAALKRVCDTRLKLTLSYLHHLNNQTNIEVARQHTDLLITSVQKELDRYKALRPINKETIKLYWDTWEKWLEPRMSGSKNRILKTIVSKRRSALEELQIICANSFKEVIDLASEEGQETIELLHHVTEQALEAEGVCLRDLPVRSAIEILAAIKQMDDLIWRNVLPDHCFDTFNSLESGRFERSRSYVDDTPTCWAQSEARQGMSPSKTERRKQGVDTLAKALSKVLRAAPSSASTSEREQSLSTIFSDHSALGASAAGAEPPSSINPANDDTPNAATASASQAQTRRPKSILKNAVKTLSLRARSSSTPPDREEQAIARALSRNQSRIGSCVQDFNRTTDSSTDTPQKRVVRCKTAQTAKNRSKSSDPSAAERLHHLVQASLVAPRQNSEDVLPVNKHPAREENHSRAVPAATPVTRTIDSTRTSARGRSRQITQNPLVDAKKSRTDSRSKSVPPLPDVPKLNAAEGASRTLVQPLTTPREGKTSGSSPRGKQKGNLVFRPTSNTNINTSLRAIDANSFTVSAARLSNPEQSALSLSSSHITNTALVEPHPKNMHNNHSTLKGQREANFSQTLPQIGAWQHATLGHPSSPRPADTCAIARVTNSLGEQTSERSPRFRPPLASGRFHLPFPFPGSTRPIHAYDHTQTHGDTTISTMHSSERQSPPAARYPLHRLASGGNGKSVYSNSNSSLSQSPLVNSSGSGYYPASPSAASGNGPVAPTSQARVPRSIIYYQTIEHTPFVQRDSVRSPRSSATSPSRELIRTNRPANGLSPSFYGSLMAAVNAPQGDESSYPVATARTSGRYSGAVSSFASRGSYTSTEQRIGRSQSGFQSCPTCHSPIGSNGQIEACFDRSRPTQGQTHACGQCPVGTSSLRWVDGAWHAG